MAQLKEKRGIKNMENSKLDALLYKAYARMSSGIVPIHPPAKADGILGTEF